MGGGGGRGPPKKEEKKKKTSFPARDGVFNKSKFNFFGDFFSGNNYYIWPPFFFFLIFFLLVRMGPHPQKTFLAMLYICHI